MVSTKFFAFYLRKYLFNQKCGLQVLPRALDGLGLGFVSNFRTNHGFSNEIKQMLEASSGTYKTFKPVAVILTRVWLSSRTWLFFLGFVLWSLFLVYSFQLLHLGLSLTQFLSLLFSGFVSRKEGDQTDSTREDEDEVEIIILELDSIEIFPIRYGTSAITKLHSRSKLHSLISF